MRRLGGRDTRLPHAVRDAEVGRKIVSAVGFVDVCRVRLVDGRVEPIGSVEEGGLASAVRADGFVVVLLPWKDMRLALASAYTYAESAG